VIITKINNLHRLFLVFIGLGCAFHAEAESRQPISACVSVEKRRQLVEQFQNQNAFLQYLQWIDDKHLSPCCGGYFAGLPAVEELPFNQMKMTAEEVFLNEFGCSKLNGHVTLQYNQQLLEADTAYAVRDQHSGKITRVELVENVSIREPGKKIVADYAQYFPEKGLGYVWNAAYRVDLNRLHSQLPGWGKAQFIRRRPNGLIDLEQASFSTCSPQSTAWKITAKHLELNPKTERGIAKHTTVRLFDKPVLYVPYLSFPISSKRQSGFLTPTLGFTNISGYDYSLPYYWNIAPNYDATLVPHLYSLRGLMMGGEFRYLDKHSDGMFVGQFLPNDQAFGKFIRSNSESYPQVQNLSKNRWSVIWHDQTSIIDRLGMKIDYQKVSDDYYLQDFSSNLSVMTENQLLRQGELDYQTDHWVMRGMLQNYQTLQPINQSFITHLYARQPQIYAQGRYDHLIGNSSFQMISQFDQFQWTGGTFVPQGPRMHFNPLVTVPVRKNYGYVQPTVEVLSNFYQLGNVQQQAVSNYSVAVPRYSLDSGLYFDKYTKLLSQVWQQTLEPRLYYLYVPYKNQTVVPSFESAYMIFNTDQLFRPNRFSGYDRIGDTNQLSYALTSRLLKTATGEEKMTLTLGQIGYFQHRRLNLCYSVDSQGNCQDSPLYLGYESPTANVSPIASRLVYSLFPNVSLVGGYVYDAQANSTNNGDMSVHFQPSPERLIHLSYSYLVNGNVIAGLRAPLEQQSLNQISAAYAWPFTEKWGSLAAYSYNISNSYAMMMLGGIQYDSCCWAMRFLGGRTFQSLEPQTLQPQYNNNIYFQILLKGLGAASNSDPSSTLQSYLPGLYNVFKH
jgi:LPS-assembly protein